MKKAVFRRGTDTRTVMGFSKSLIAAGVTICMICAGGASIGLGARADDVIKVINKQATPVYNDTSMGFIEGVDYIVTSDVSSHDPTKKLRRTESGGWYPLSPMDVGDAFEPLSTACILATDVPGLGWNPFGRTWPLILEMEDDVYVYSGQYQRMCKFDPETGDVVPPTGNSTDNTQGLQGGL